MGVRGQPTKWNQWYSTDRWARIKKQQLLAHARCQFCLERGIVTPAEICDHIEPHHGDPQKFWNTDNWQPLCRPHHDGTKQRQEKRMTGVGVVKSPRSSSRDRCPRKSSTPAKFPRGVS